MSAHQTPPESTPDSAGRELAQVTWLDSLRAYYREIGCRECSLGIVKMPTGYLLLLNADESHYFWAARDTESVIHWNRWAIYRGAKSHASKSNARTERPAPTADARKH